MPKQNQPMLPIILEKEISPTNFQWLKEVWEITTEQLGIPKSQSEQIFKIIRAKYSEPHRAYHNLSHIYSMLMMAEEFYDFIEQNHLFDLSIWFHDLIYDASRQDNETQSAKLAIELLQPFLPKYFLDDLNEMIVSTKAHTPLLAHHDNKFFLDLDLAILATDAETYSKYVQAIRIEYSIFPKELYNAGRKHVMSNFLEKDNIYFTSFFQERFEEIARKNIREEISLLG